MRRGHNNSWLKDEKGNLVALNLGADYTAEHEWGIKGIRSAFGLLEDETVFGVERRRITQIPGTRNWRGIDEHTLLYDEFGPKKRPEAALIFEKWGGDKLMEALKKPTGDNRYVAQEISLPKWDEKLAAKNDSTYYYLSTSWSEDDFGIHVRGEENVAKLHRLYDALLDKDLAIWLGGGHVFQNAGLVLGIVSAIPEENLKTMREADENAAKLKLASKETGIEAFLQSKGKTWYALSPRWIFEDRKSKSAFPVMYWLNPTEQQKYESNYFTVEELKQWAEETGPVIKAPKAVKP